MNNFFEMAHDAMKGPLLVIDEVARFVLLGLRLLLYALLAILEPIVRVLLSALALISLLTCAFFAWLTPLHDFPLWSVYGNSEIMGTELPDLNAGAFVPG